MSEDKGERGPTRSVGDTNSPHEYRRPDANKEGNVLQKDNNTGNTVSKPVPAGFKEYWENMKK